MISVDFFRGVSDYLWNLSKPDGKLLCYKHRIEHTGKNAYSVITDLFLFRETNEEKYWERAKIRALRVAGNLMTDPKHGQYMYWPGRLGKTNMSNSVIDSGGATDSLSEIILQYGNKLTPRESEKIKAAIFKNSGTYLKEAVYKKELPDQRLWGGSGLASAYKIFSAEGGSATGGKAQEWKESLLKSIERTLSQQWPDGILPYHPNWKEYGLPSNMEETTPFYHSRQVGFIFHILDCIKESAEPYREALSKAGEVLLAFYTPNGKKVMALETKRWYWFGQYEVASYGFDLYTLVRLYELTGDERYLQTASHIFDILKNHIQPDGGITSQLEGNFDFQCRIFWNAHLAWLARVVKKIPEHNWYTPIKTVWQHFISSDIVKYESPNLVAMWRGSKKPVDTLYGPSLGGGSLLYLGRPETNWENILRVEEWQEKIPLNFWIQKNRGWSLKLFLKFLKAEKINPRGLLYYLYTEIYGVNWPGIKRRAKDLFLKLWSGGRDVYSSAWATEVKTGLVDGGVKFTLCPTKRNGEKLASVSIERTYEPKGAMLMVREKITITDPHLQCCYYGLNQVRQFSEAGTFEYSYQLE